jgi:hypothetical protein
LKVVGFDDKYRYNYLQMLTRKPKEVLENPEKPFDHHHVAKP